MRSVNTELLTSVQITTDGSCLGNPGPGGWAAILRMVDGHGTVHGREIAGFGEARTTNCRMEILAALLAVQCLNQPSRVTIRTDATYLIWGLGKLTQWRHCGCPAETPNADLWQALADATARHEITWFKVKGHSSDRENSRCDELAKKAARDSTAVDRRFEDRRAA